MEEKPTALVIGHQRKSPMNSAYGYLGIQGYEVTPWKYDEDFEDLERVVLLPRWHEDALCRGLAIQALKVGLPMFEFHEAQNGDRSLYEMSQDDVVNQMLGIEDASVSDQPVLGVVVLGMVTL